MLDLKTMKSALEQLEEERCISKEKIIDAIEAALAAAYKKDYGKKGQIVRAKLDMDTRVQFNPEHNIMIKDKKLTKKDAEFGKELVLNLEEKDELFTKLRIFF